MTGTDPTSTDATVPATGTSTDLTSTGPTPSAPDATPSKQHGDPLLASARDEDRGEPGSRQGVDLDGDGAGEPA